MTKQIKFNEDARASIKKGIDKLAEAVIMTLGPRGRAVVIEKSYGAPQVTFDGVTVAKEIELEDACSGERAGGWVDLKHGLSTGSLLWLRSTV